MDSEIMKTTVGTAGKLVLGLILFVAAVNVIWWVAPIFGSADVYRPLFGIVVVLVGSVVWRQIGGDENENSR